LEALLLHCDKHNRTASITATAMSPNSC
jgi:hypothetical protein